MRFFATFLPCVLAIGGCSREVISPPERSDAPSAGSVAARPTTARGPRPGKATFIEAEASNEPVAAVVQRERGRIEGAGGRLIVAVGAPWCEPCRRFHAAVTEGKLDAAIPGVVFLEFDHDRDGDRLREAGYTSRLIPLYVVPDAAGRAPTDPRMRLEGSIKGDGAVAEITPRLLRLLEAGAR